MYTSLNVRIELRICEGNQACFETDQAVMMVPKHLCSPKHILSISFELKLRQRFQISTLKHLSKSYATCNE